MPKEFKNICQKYKYTKFTYQMLLDYKNKRYEKKKINEELKEKVNDNIELDNKDEAHKDNNNDNNNNKNTIRDENNKMEIK